MQPINVFFFFPFLYIYVCTSGAGIRSFYHLIGSNKENSQFNWIGVARPIKWTKESTRRYLIYLFSYNLR